MSDSAALRDQLKSIGQEQVLRFFDQLNPIGREKLTNQIHALDLHHIRELADAYVKHKPEIHLPKDIKPVEAYPRVPRTAGQRDLYARAERRGHELLRQGKVGAFLVAGGQGTRLGYDGPKGEFPVTPVKNKPLFQVFAEQLLGYGRDAGRAIPWYIMTSDINDEQTQAFFREHDFFGINPDDVLFFRQAMMPAFGLDGRMLLEAKDSLALSPAGHGASLRAIDKSRALADMNRRGIEHLSYFQVDNPLVHTIDPLFLGLHDLTGSEMSSKTIPKAEPLERVGNFAIGDGKLQVIEYSDLPESLAMAKTGDGTLKFNAGSIAIHALSVPFVARLNASGRLELPWHRAEKKVPYIDDAGNVVKPDKPNAVKLEQFVFDAIPLAKNAIVYETDRAEEFSPVKNASGVDSPHTCRRDQIRRAGNWLRSAGVHVPDRGDGEPNATLEISPLLATSAQQLRTRDLSKLQIEPAAVVYLGE